MLPAELMQLPAPTRCDAVRTSMYASPIRERPRQREQEPPPQQPCLQPPPPRESRPRRAGPGPSADARRGAAPDRRFCAPEPRAPAEARRPPPGLAPPGGGPAQCLFAPSGSSASITSDAGTEASAASTTPQPPAPVSGVVAPPARPPAAERSRSLNEAQRRKVQRGIERDNVVLAQRLSATRPTLDARADERSFLRHRRNTEMLRKMPDGRSRPRLPRSLPPIRPSRAMSCPTTPPQGRGRHCGTLLLPEDLQRAERRLPCTIKVNLHGSPRTPRIGLRPHANTEPACAIAEAAAEAIEEAAAAAYSDSSPDGALSARSADDAWPMELARTASEPLDTTAELEARLLSRADLRSPISSPQAHFNDIPCTRIDLSRSFKPRHNCVVSTALLRELALAAAPLSDRSPALRGSPARALSRPPRQPSRPPTSSGCGSFVGSTCEAVPKTPPRSRARFLGRGRSPLRQAPEGFHAHASVPSPGVGVCASAWPSQSDFVTQRRKWLAADARVTPESSAPTSLRSLASSACRDLLRQEMVHSGMVTETDVDYADNWDDFSFSAASPAQLAAAGSIIAAELTRKALAMEEAAG